MCKRDSDNGATIRSLGILGKSRLIADIPDAAVQYRRTRKHPTEKRGQFPSDTLDHAALTERLAASAILPRQDLPRYGINARHSLCDSRTPIA